MGKEAALIDQSNWRFYEDDAAEPTAPLANQNTAPTLANNDDKIRLRVNLPETAGFGVNNVDVTIEYSTDDAAFNAFGAAAHWNYADGQGPEGNTLASNLISTANVKAQYVESAGGVGTYDYGASEETEWDICIVPTGNVSGSTTYYFRLLIDGVECALETSKTDTHPSLTTAAGASPSGQHFGGIGIG